MKRSDGIKYLTQCADRQGNHWYQGRVWSDVETCPTCRGSNDAGHLACFSRYGRTAADCAPVAWRLAYVITGASGEPITPDALDHAMSLVVNEHDDVAYVIRTYGGYRYR